MSAAQSNNPYAAAMAPTSVYEQEYQFPPRQPGQSLGYFANAGSQPDLHRQTQNVPALLQVPQRPAQQRQRSASSSNVPTGRNVSLLSPNPGPPLTKHSANKSHSNLAQLFNVENPYTDVHPASLRHASGDQLVVPRKAAPTQVYPVFITPPAVAVPNARVNADYNFVNAKGQPIVASLPKKKRGLFSSAKLSKSHDTAMGPAAWIAGQAEKVPYDLALLASGAKVSF
jgi:hypothetical protein